MVRRLIAGPPCSGKSTHVEQHKGPDDEVICLDTIAMDLGSPVPWGHAPNYMNQADAILRQRLIQLRDTPPHLDPHDIWVIRSLANPTERRQLAEDISAELTTLDPGEAVCLDRARHRPSGTTKAVRTWYWAARRDAKASTATLQW
jgi:hypothetical protein